LRIFSANKFVDFDHKYSALYTEKPIPLV
jgi:hypothetical protein